MDILRHAAIQKPSPIAYKDAYIIPFGLCLKDVVGEWEDWLRKFERAFMAIDTSEALVVGHIPYWRTEDFDGRFYYLWRMWECTGGPRVFS